MDKIVSTVYFEGEVYIFTEYGKVYRMIRDSITGVSFQSVAKLDLH